MFCAKCGNQIPDGVKFCPFCGEKLAEAVSQTITEVTQTAETAVQEAAQNVAEAAQEAAAPVVEAAAPAVEAAAPVVEAAAPVQEPVQQPVYQQPVYQQPVYQQPQQPVYQQPVYQQPQQPVYQQMLYQQPQETKKKSKAPWIILIIVLVLLLAAGGLFVWINFIAEDVPDALSWAKVIEKESDLVLSEKQQKEFTKIVKNMDQAIIDTDGDAYEDCIPSYARKFVWSVYGETTADGFVKYLYGDKENGIAGLGDDLKVTEEIVNAKKISDLEDLAECFDDVFDKTIEFDAAYLVTNNSCFKGDEDSEKYVDYYLFFQEADEDEWNVILIGEENLEKFNLD